MKKIILIAAVAIAAAACSKTFDTNLATEKAIGFSTWNETMTKASKDAFATDDVIEVFGHKGTGVSAVDVFEAQEVTKQSDGTWKYSPLRFWDTHFDSYTFYGVYPKDVLAAGSYAADGKFVTGNITFDGVNEKLLVAQEKTVAQAAYGEVPLLFKHTNSLIDIKVKKHSDITDAKVVVNSIALSGIKINGSFEVDSYNTDKNPVGATVSTVAGLGWTPGSNVNADAAPYKKTDATTLTYGAGVGVANASNLIESLVVMPQAFTATAGPAITINYSVISGSATDGDLETITYTPGAFYIGAFDITDPDPSPKDNEDAKITAWMPGVHYTYYITINSNVITFSATIDGWDDATNALHYIVK